MPRGILVNLMIAAVLWHTVMGCRWSNCCESQPDVAAKSRVTPQAPKSTHRCCRHFGQQLAHQLPAQTPPDNSSRQPERSPDFPSQQHFPAQHDCHGVGCYFTFSGQPVLTTGNASSAVLNFIIDNAGHDQSRSEGISRNRPYTANFSGLSRHLSLQVLRI